MSLARTQNHDGLAEIARAFANFTIADDIIPCRLYSQQDYESIS
jgi:hypothetical protein